MKKFKSIISFVLVMAMLLAMNSVLSISASAATTLTEKQFATKIEALRKEYPEGKYWNQYNGVDSEGIAKAGSNVCSGTSNSNGKKCTANGYCGYGGSCTCKCGEFHGSQCFGFANLMAYKIFGSYATNNYSASGVNSSKGWSYHNSVSNYYAGDVVRINGNHSIFITKVTESTAYYVECNYDGPCKIDWDNSISIASLKSKTTFVVRMSGNTLTGTGETLEVNTLTINYNVNGGTILSDILSYDYKVTEEIGINMRDTASTGGTKLTALPKGTTFTVKSDEIKTADGYTWGKTTYKEYTGWVVISDFVEQTGISYTSNYYVDSSLVYKSSSSSKVNDTNEYGVYNETGLYNASTFGLVKEGYDFVGWSFTPTGEQIIDQDMGFKPEEIVPELENGSLTVTVYAIWKRNVKLNIMFTYDANGGTGVMSETIGIEGANVTFDANTFVNEGYDFAGWQIQRADGKWYIEEYGWYSIDLIEERGYTITTYADGAEIALDSDFVTLDYDFTCTLHAVWVEKPEPVASFEIKSISHEVSADRVIFTVTTTPDFNRVKVTSVENLASYISYSSNYIVNSDGDYVFTLSVPAVEGVSQYAFDGRRADTNKYAKAYAYIQFEIEETIPTIISASHEFSNDKIIFTVITKAGNFSRIKVTTADNLGGSVGVASTYTVNADGNYVWTIKAAEPTKNTNYAFDLRNAETGKYLKDYSYYEVEAATPTILSVSHTVSDGKIVFTVVTKAGNFSRIKVTDANNLGGSLGVANAYTVNADGNYVWTIKAAEPTENTNYAFDLRNADTGKYLKEYFYYAVEAATPDILNVTHAVSGGKIVFTVTTKAGDYDRIKATLADNLGGSVAVATSYAVDANGNYIWTIKAPLSDATSYAFDLRVAGGRYQKDYFIYNI